MGKQGKVPRNLFWLTPATLARWETMQMRMLAMGATPDFYARMTTIIEEGLAVLESEYGIDAPAPLGFASSSQAWPAVIGRMVFSLLEGAGLADFSGLDMDKATAKHIVPRCDADVRESVRALILGLRYHHAQKALVHVPGLVARAVDVLVRGAAAANRG